LRKRIACGGFIGLLLACAALAQPGIDADGVADGKTVLWFHGSRVTAEVQGALRVDGFLSIAGTSVAFTARGTALGEAIGDSAAATFDVWILVEAAGSAETGDPISLRGGIVGSSASGDLASGTFGSAAGSFFLLITFGEDVYQAHGTANGSAVGAFVVPADPLTMQMEGTASYDLVGDLVAGAGPAAEGEPPHSVDLTLLPWDAASWPAELFARFLALLDGPSAAPGAEPAVD
jgi:hypothetical protein